MVKYYKSVNGLITPANENDENIWINMVDPTNDEIKIISDRLHIDPVDMKASLDDEEASRIEYNDEYTLVIVDEPVREVRHDNDAYTTMPLAIIITDNATITVTLEESLVLKPFIERRITDVNTNKKMRFLNQILYSNATVYQNCLRIIDKKREVIEGRLGAKTMDSDLVELHELETNLVYFATSLRFNGVVLDKMTRYAKFNQYPEDRELLDDVVIESKQAIEMTNIYRDIINGTRELFASVIDNQLNSIMKFLTSITLVMSIPTMISGLYGMNVDTGGMPFAGSIYGFGVICIFSLLLCVVITYVLKKRNML